MSMRKRFLAIAVVSSAAICSSANSAAQVIIDSPDQLADGVVNSAKILDRTVRQRDEANPTLRFSVQANGQLITGDMGGNPEHVPGSNRYDLSFSSSDLGPNGLNTCAFAVSPRFEFTQAPGHDGHLNMRAYVNYARGSNTFQVFTYEQLPNGSEVPAEAAFDVVVGC